MSVEKLTQLENFVSLYNEAYDKNPKGSLMRTFEDSNEEQKEKFIGELYSVIEEKHKEREEEKRRYIEAFHNRIDGMVEDYNISKREAIIWDMEGFDFAYHPRDIEGFEFYLLINMIPIEEWDSIMENMK